jgi:UDP-N-acetylglucosamine--N-acetylmuramyl-(pentapeptide) pyrophosphoryl-undecaprenol N-acetylglucosamine transferase
MKSCVVFTGGGSGGHVMPALTLIEYLKEQQPLLSIHYLGSYRGIERELTKSREIEYSPISSGKLRRYFSVENFIDIFRVLKGVLDAYFLLKRIRSENEKIAVVATGGFVCVPVALAAWILKIPVFLHEQTSRAGLANRIVARFAKIVFISFESSKDYFDQQETILSGYPVREECFSPKPTQIIVNDRIITHDRPILFVTGGGNGSALLNELVKNSLDGLTTRFLVIHQVGNNFIKEYESLASPHYIPLGFINSEMIPLMKIADCIISRAGAGTVSELLAMKKRSIFIPLKIAQKNEQYYNAMEAVKVLNSLIIEEDELHNHSLLKTIEDFMLESHQNTRQVLVPDAKKIITQKLVEFLIIETKSH